ncbi:response regulator [Falsigemmobacter intermedius]|uniref:Response regulator transcription factor n=1 Tax=Falsigemmobacter intermedius TaxID=1553448 RepID=A0A444MER3_9RHOB|nr:response regulator [Falsigemmobacter intermedius]RWY43481.1 response regulator transcription factor [Falsigemmobacter intermedius]
MPVNESLTRPDQLPRPAVGLPLWGLTILLVEDSRFAADGLRLMALRGGARLRRADSLAQARRHLGLYLPDIVLVDPGLPDGEGEALIADLAPAFARTQRPVVLAISGDPGKESACLAAGAAGFLSKPVAGFSEFVAFLRAHRPDPRDGGGDLPAVRLPLPDDLALREDLIFAQRRLAQSGSEQERVYLSGFLEGLARTTADPALAEAAGALATRGSDRARDLSHLIRQRIADLPQPFLRAAI